MGNITSLESDIYKTLVVSMNKAHAEQKTQKILPFLVEGEFRKSNGFLAFLNVDHIFNFIKCFLHHV